MKKVLLSTLICICAVFARAQVNPVQLTVRSQKIKDQSFEIHITATIESPWHLYSQSTPEGGPVSTTIAFSKNPLVMLDGAVKEQGKLKQRYEESFGVDVRYYEGSVTFVQAVQVKAKVTTTVSGSIRFMVCNDRECLPPRNIPFWVVLKGGK